MNPKQNDEGTIQDLSGDEAEKVAGGGILRGGGMTDPEPTPEDPPNGTLIDI